MKTSDLKKLTGLSIIYFLLLVLLNVALGNSVAATLCISIILGVTLAYTDYSFEHEKVSLYANLDKRKTIISRLENLGYSISKKVGDKTYFINNTKNLLDDEAVIESKDYFLRVEIPDDLEKFFLGFRLQSRIA